MGIASSFLIAMTSLLLASLRATKERGNLKMSMLLLADAELKIGEAKQVQHDERFLHQTTSFLTPYFEHLLTYTNRFYW